MFKNKNNIMPLLCASAAFNIGCSWPVNRVKIKANPVYAKAPTVVPTENPTAVPTENPTAVPTENPTAVPTENPTAVPTENPTVVPTANPTAVPAPSVIISIGSPSVSITSNSHSVNYIVSYTNATAITLSAADIQLNTSNASSCNISVSGTGIIFRTVTLSSCTGGGMLGLSIAANSAVNADAIPAASYGPSATFKICPANYVAVLGNADLGSGDFCIAKYEMKNVSGNAVSQVNNTPWGDITKNNAITACQAVGSGYDLVSNIEWQTTARNIANQGSNWSTSSVGQGYLNIGLFNSNVPCDASLENINGNCTTVVSTFLTKRTHTLSNGDIIWDLGGNLYEIVKDVSTQGQYSASFRILTRRLGHGSMGAVLNI